MEAGWKLSVTTFVVALLAVTAPVAASVAVPGGGGGVGEGKESRAASVAVPDGPSTAAVDAAATDGTYDLSGRVVNRTGATVSSGTVELVDGNGTVVASRQIDADGGYALSNLTGGEYRLKASVEAANVTADTDVTLDGTLTRDLMVLTPGAATTPVQVVIEGAPDGLRSYNLTLDAPGRIATLTPGLLDGQSVQTPAGGVGNRSVEVRAASVGGVSGFDGTRTLLTVAFVGVVDPANVSVQVGTLRNRSGGSMNGSRVELRSGVANATVAGRVLDGTGRPVEAGNATVELRRVLPGGGTTSVANATVGQNGTYAFPDVRAGEDYELTAETIDGSVGSTALADLPAGNASVDVTVPGYRTGSATGNGTTVQVLLDGAPDGLRAYNVTLTGPANLTGVTPELIDGEAFEIVAGGVGARSVTVRAADLNQVSSFSGVRTLFTAEFAGEVDQGSVAASVNSLENDSGGAMDPTRVNASVASANATLTGQAVNGTGVPIPAGDATVELRRVTNASGVETVGNATVGVDGTYTFVGVPAGDDYEVVVAAVDGTTGSTRIDAIPSGTVRADVTVPGYGTGGTGVQVVLEGAPDGLSRYNLTVAGPSRLTAVTPGLIGGRAFQIRTGGVGDQSIGVRAADASDQIGAFEGTRTLLTVQFAGAVEVANLSLEVADLSSDPTGPNDSISPMDPSRVSLRAAGGNTTVTGRAVNGSGVPIPAGNATVQLSRVTNASGSVAVATATVGQNGTFRLPEVPAGEAYELVVEAIDGSSGRTTLRDLPAGSVDVEVVVDGYGAPRGNETIQVIATALPNGTRQASINVSTDGPVVTDFGAPYFGDSLQTSPDDPVGESSARLRAVKLSPNSASSTVVLFDVTFNESVRLDEVNVTINEIRQFNQTAPPPVNRSLIEVRHPPEPEPLSRGERLFPDGIGSADSPPTNTDDDAQFEDIDGNGRFEFVDVIEFVFVIKEPRYTTDASPEQVEALDHNGDGEVDFVDVIALVFEV
jgi:hypothetical protein